ncbi:MAG: hypothetical protein M1836_003079 [Candelina mexicana]|nr:MAG: hypothetical protein M1836_003079 [Candelina mexicana]
MASAILGNLCLGARRTSLPKTNIPPLIFHTLKTERTKLTDTVSRALNDGQRGFDTSPHASDCRPGWTSAINAGLAPAFGKHKLRRDDIFIQKRFRPHSVKKHVSTPLAKQVHTFISDSLISELPRTTDRTVNLKHLDLVTLEWPEDVTNRDHPNYQNQLKRLLLTWRLLEEYVPSKVHHLGLDKVPLPAVESIHKAVHVKPCLASHGFPLWRDDAILKVQEYCLAEGIVFTGRQMQAWWKGRVTKEASKDMQYISEFLSPLCLQFDLPQQVLIGCLAAGLENTTFVLELLAPQVIRKACELQNWAQNNRQEWQSLVQEFQELIRLPRVQ